WNSMMAVVQQCGSTDEVFFLEVDHFAEPEFVRRILLRRDQRLLAADVIHFDQQQASLDASYVEGEHPSGVQIEGSSLLRDCVPNSHGIVPGHPDFVPEISRIAGA